MEKELHEANQYKDAAFPAQMYTVTQERIVPKGRGYLDLHWHEELQFTLVVSGKMTMQADGVSYPLNEGEAIFLNRNVLHMSSRLSNDGCYVSFNFPEKLLGFFPGSRMERDGVLPLTGNTAFSVMTLKNNVAWQREALSLLWEMKDCFDRMDAGLFGEYHPEYLAALLFVKLWYELITHIDSDLKKESGTRKRERIRGLMTFVHEHYMEDITLFDIADSEGISEGECWRCFKEIAGESPMHYLGTYRIKKAMELLTSTSQSVTAIAHEVGFTDAGYFTRCFKKKTGVTPVKYRSM